MLSSEWSGGQSGLYLVAFFMVLIYTNDPSNPVQSLNSWPITWGFYYYYIFFWQFELLALWCYVATPLQNTDTNLTGNCLMYQRCVCVCKDSFMTWTRFGDIVLINLRALYPFIDDNLCRWKTGFKRQRGRIKTPDCSLITTASGVWEWDTLLIRDDPRVPCDYLYTVLSM